MSDKKDTFAAIYIPSIYKKAINRTTTILAKKFGGTTNYAVKGTRLDEKENLVEEDVTVIKTFYDKEEHLFAEVFIISLAALLRESCKQDCIVVEVEGEMMLV